MYAHVLLLIPALISDALKWKYSDKLCVIVNWTDTLDSKIREDFGAEKIAHTIYTCTYRK